MFNVLVSTQFTLSRYEQQIVLTNIIELTHVKQVLRLDNRLVIFIFLGPVANLCCQPVKRSVPLLFLKFHYPEL